MGRGIVRLKISLCILLKLNYLSRGQKIFVIFIIQRKYLMKKKNINLYKYVR